MLLLPGPSHDTPRSAMRGAESEWLRAPSATDAPRATENRAPWWLFAIGAGAVVAVYAAHALELAP